MQYVISFLEGIITFISPCLLPMLPIYISYFAGGGERSTKKTLTGALGFVLGFTLVFVAMGALAGTLGSFLKKYQTVVNVVSGLIVILFGLNFMGVLKLNLFRGGAQMQVTPNGFFSSALFGMIFSVGWTPCVGTFLNRTDSYKLTNIWITATASAQQGCAQSDIFDFWYTDFTHKKFSFIFITRHIRYSETRHTLYKKQYLINLYSAFFPTILSRTT